MKEVYPRVCGGTSGSYTPGISSRGLSPRVRGNPNHQPPVDDAVGSIPACAGEPSSSSSPITIGWVYPRVCGGTSATIAAASKRCGLSPRVRGNRMEQMRMQMDVRSIPACAGEPLLHPPRH